MLDRKIEIAFQSIVFVVRDHSGRVRDAFDIHFVLVGRVIGYRFDRFVGVWRFARGSVVCGVRVGAFRAECVACMIQDTLARI